VGFLRAFDEAPKLNRKTVDGIGKRLLAMSIDDLMKLCKQPMVDNRRMGELFHKWFSKLTYPKLDWDEFRDTDERRDLRRRKQNVFMLNGSRKDFRRFANEELDCGLEKELDLLLKVNGQYIIGEAKFFSNYGGNQKNQFRDAVNSFLLENQGTASRIAVLDGVLWLDNQNYMCKKIRQMEGNAMSALLLPRFIEHIQTDA
jgi:hypothetical protein